MKNKIITMGILFVFIAMSFSSINADMVVNEELKEETVTVGFSAVDSKGLTQKYELKLTEEKFSKLKTALSELSEKIENIKDFKDIRNILDKSFEEDYPILYFLLTTFGSTLINNTNFIVSSGYGYKLKLLNQKELTSQKRSLLWHYSKSPDKKLPTRTLIIKGLDINPKILSGKQIGFMTKFTGIYLFIPEQYPEKSYTFFIGAAKMAFGIELKSLL